MGYTRNDVIKDLLKHRALVSSKMSMIGNDLAIRGRRHDNSKSEDTEVTLAIKAYYENGEDDNHFYNLSHATHVANNDHHPAHFENGISDMNLVQLTEYVCDIMSIAEEYYENEPSVENYMYEVMRDNPLGIPSDIAILIENTIQYIITRKQQLKGPSISNSTGGGFHGEKQEG